MIKRLISKIKRNTDLFLILLIAFVVRIVQIYKVEMWYDESFTGVLMRVPLNEFWQTLKTEPHPPLYYMMMKAWTLVFGVNDISLRAFSVVCGLLTIYFVYKICKKLFNSDVAGISATLAAFNPFLVAYSVEARSYAIFGLLVIFCFYLILEKRYLLFGIWGAVLCMIHFTSVLYIPILVFYSFVKSLTEKNISNKLKGFNAAMSLIPFAVFGWLVNSIYQKTEVDAFNDTWITEPNDDRILKSFWAFIFGIKAKLAGSENYNYLNFNIDFKLLYFALIIFIICLICIYLAYSTFKKDFKFEYLIFLALAFSTPFAFVVIYKLLDVNIYLERYMIPSSIFLIMCIGVAMRKLLSFEVSALILVGYILLLFKIVPQDYYSGMRTIGERFKSENREVVMTSPQDYMVARYYLGEDFSTKNLRILEPKEPNKLYNQWPLTPISTKVINQSSAIFVSPNPDRITKDFQELDSSVDFGDYKLYSKSYIVKLN